MFILPRNTKHFFLSARSIQIWEEESFLLPDTKWINIFCLLIWANTTFTKFIRVISIFQYRYLQLVGDDSNFFMRARNALPAMGTKCLIVIYSSFDSWFLLRNFQMGNKIFSRFRLVQHVLVQFSNSNGSILEFNGKIGPPNKDTLLVNQLARDEVTKVSKFFTQVVDAIHWKHFIFMCKISS